MKNRKQKTGLSLQTLIGIATISFPYLLFLESEKPKMVSNPENIVSLLRKDSKKWLALLTNEEKRAIRKYTYNTGDDKASQFYKRLNTMLRGESLEDTILFKYSDIISNAICKNRLKRFVVCYRGLNYNPADGYEIGDIFQMRQFVSTSVIETKCFTGEVKMIIYAPAGTQAAYIENLSHYPKQREMLFDKDCYFELISNENNVIELETRL